MMPSLCETCENFREICTARSRFLLCELSFTNAAYPKYPPQPVVRCDGYRSWNESEEGEQGSVRSRLTDGVDQQRPVTKMLPLCDDPHFTFRFADDRIIPRFHLEDVKAGRQVAVYKIGPGSGERLGLLATASVGEGGWVDLPEPITVRAGDAFIAVLGPAAGDGT